MMQIMRCESAVAQGLRSDTFQATKRATSASKQPLPPYPFGLLVADLPPPSPSLAPKSTPYLRQDLIGSQYALLYCPK